MSDDPDETEGRRLYRARANALANAQIAMAARKIKLRRDEMEHSASPEQAP
jgi:hypothetical protein